MRGRRRVLACTVGDSPSQGEARNDCPQRAMVYCLASCSRLASMSLARGSPSLAAQRSAVSPPRDCSPGRGRPRCRNWRGSAWRGSSPPQQRGGSCAGRRLVLGRALLPVSSDMPNRIMPDVLPAFAALRIHSAASSSGEIMLGGRLGNAQESRTNDRQRGRYATHRIPPGQTKIGGR